MSSAHVSIPVEVDGLRGVVSAGDTFNELGDEKRAKKLAKVRANVKNREMGGEKVSQHDDVVKRNTALSNPLPDVSMIPKLSLIIRADVIGTAEALKDAILKLSSEFVEVDILQVGVGNITNNDVMLAATSREGGKNATILAFNVKMASSETATLADRDNVRIIKSAIIYDFLEEVSALLRLTAPAKEEEAVVGVGNVLKLFDIKKKQGVEAVTIAGSKVISGRLVSSTGPQSATKLNFWNPSGSNSKDNIDSFRRFAKDYKELIYRKYRIIRENNSRKRKGDEENPSGTIVFEGLVGYIFQASRLGWLGWDG